MSHPEKGQRQPEAVKTQAEGSQWQARGSHEAARRDWEPLGTHKGDHLEHPVTLFGAWGNLKIPKIAKSPSKSPNPPEH